jgi:hypothetical protein
MKTPLAASAASFAFTPSRSKDMGVSYRLCFLDAVSLGRRWKSTATLNSFETKPLAKHFQFDRDAFTGLTTACSRVKIRSNDWLCEAQQCCGPGLRAPGASVP